MISCKFSGVAKWNLSHCLSCWDDPSLGLTLVLSLLQELKKKEGRKEGRKNLKEKEEEGIKKERKEDWI